MGYGMSQALTLIAFLVLARLAAPEVFGEFAAASIVVGVGALLAESGMLAAVVQRGDRVEEAASTAAVSTLAAGVCFSLLALAAAPLIGLFFDSSRVGEVAAVMSGTLLLRNLSIAPEAVLLRRLSFFRRVVIEPVSVLAFAVAAIIAVDAGMGVWGLVVGQYAGAAADLVLSWAIVRWRPRLSLVSFGMWKELASYGRHVVGATIVLRLGDQVPVALLGRYAGEATLGQYRYAERVAVTPYAMILAAASYVLFPVFSRIQAEGERLRAAYRRSLRWICMLGFPLAFVMVPLGEPLVVLVFGEPWREAGQALPAICLYPALSPLVSLASEAFKAIGRPQLLLRMHVVTTAVGSAAMAALLGFDLVGVLAGISVGSAVGAGYSLRLARDQMGQSMSGMWAQIWPPLIASLVMAAALFPLEHSVLQAADRATGPGLLILSGELLISAGVYLAVLGMLARDTFGELATLRNGLRAVREDAPA